MQKIYSNPNIYKYIPKYINKQQKTKQNKKTNTKTAEYMHIKVIIIIIIDKIS